MRKLFIFLIIAALFLSACGVKNEARIDSSFDSATTNVVYNPSSNGVLSMYAIRYDTLNPLLTAYSVNRDMLSLVFDPLVQASQNYSIENKLVENFIISNGGKTITLYLRKDVKWHSGEPFTARDVDYTITQIMNYPEDCIYKDNLKDIEYTQIIDNTTYEITLSKPNSGFVYLLDFPVIQYANCDIEDSKDDFYINGTGMYKVGNVDKFSSVTLTANESWWGGTVNIKQVDVRLLPDEKASYNGFGLGSIDVAVVNSENVSKYNVGENIGYKVTNGNRYTYLSLDLSNPVLADVRMRKLIKRMTPETKVVEELLPGFAMSANSPINPAAVYAVAIESPETDIKEELDALGYKQGDNGVRSAEYDDEIVPLEFTMLVNGDNPSKLIISDYLVSVMAGYGIVIKVVAKPEEEYHTEAAENLYDFVLCETKISPDTDLEFLIGTEGSLNFSGYSNLLTDNTIAQVATAETIDQRNALLGDLQRDFYNDMPHIPLYFSNNKLFYNTDIFAEINAGALNKVFGNINTWSLK